MACGFGGSSPRHRGDGAGRRRRFDHAVEFRPVLHLRQARHGAGGRLHGCHQAERDECDADPGLDPSAPRGRPTPRCLQHRHGRGDVVGSALTRHSDVAKISFTGSTAVGKVIFRDAAGTLKGLTPELGGKSPSIILDDADLEEAVTGALRAGFVNSGQACVAGTRILVPESRLDEVLAIATAAAWSGWGSTKLIRRRLRHVTRVGCAPGPRGLRTETSSEPVRTPAESAA
jgi:hypothetical protein